MLTAQQAAPGQVLTDDAIRATLYAGLAGKFTGAKVLALIPDHTRTIPLPQLFPVIVDALRDTRQLDFMVALGTHLPLSVDAMQHLVGLTADERATTYQHIGLLIQDWQNPTPATKIALTHKNRRKA